MGLGSFSIYELEQMMDTSDMKIFCAVANILVQKNSREAYHVLKKYAFSSDEYKKRYILSVIFEYSDAVELVDELDKILRNEKSKTFMINTVLEVIIKYNIKMDAEVVAQALENSDLDSGWNYQVIGTFEKNEKNLELFLRLYHMKRKCNSIRIAIAEQLLEFVNEENYLRLFSLFEKDEQPQIRKVACQIALKMNRQDLLLVFKDDTDGHIRKYVKNNIKA